MLNVRSVTTGNDSTEVTESVHLLLRMHRFPTGLLANFVVAIPTPREIFCPANRVSKCSLFHRLVGMTRPQSPICFLLFNIAV